MQMAIVIRLTRITIQTLPDKSVRWDDTAPNLSKGLTTRSHEEVAQTLPGIPRNFLAIIKMNFHETNKQCRRENSTDVVLLCLLLTSCGFVWGPSTGGWWWFIIHHPRKDRFVHQRGERSIQQRTKIYVYYTTTTTTNWREACCECKSTCVISFAFLSVIIRTVSWRVFFFLRNKSQRTNIFIGI